ncbi:hypothetical protein CC85DRAFT_298724 [Cutaneotrichosporon oleaginosum]|uniref:Uncharacterized protein n=1 Tax=Cutaneotrichosporon oleaginosum TaxID=879819 RepID=A0A0J0XZS9_9TREE|nr:uncharacterized protein CC85DRAFT_298724 [Cutaneotrichosporon oleaginosum]KLT46538.1 hypothetical protein CC85DRAFT_298724 [Cutaneotrichosporon oleaginosum]TXT15095.1 hypothetical protein COLE_01288 [Cutaneotrichosporon oleaginosum]
MQTEAYATVDGAARLIGFATPLELGAGAHIINVTFESAVRLIGVTWDGPMSLKEVSFAPEEGNIAIVDELSTAGDGASRQKALWTVSRSDASAHITLPMNVTAFQLRGLVGPSAGSFIIAFNPSVGIPFSGNATSDVTDPIALLCAVTLDPRKHYTVDISSADAETLHLSSWGFAADE